MFQKNYLEFNIIPKTCKIFLKALEDKFLIIKTIEEEILNPRRRIDKRKVGPFESLEFLEALSDKDLEHLPIYEKSKELVGSPFYFNMIIVYFISVWEAFNDDLLKQISDAFSHLNYDIQQVNLVKKLDGFLPRIKIYFPEICVLKEFYYRRNSIVHNNGKADQKYLDRTKKLLKYLKIQPEIDTSTKNFLTKYKDIEYLYDTIDSSIKTIYAKSIDYVRNNK